MFNGDLAVASTLLKYTVIDTTDISTQGALTKVKYKYSNVTTVELIKIVYLKAT